MNFFYCMFHFIIFWLFNNSFWIFVDRCQCINKTNPHVFFFHWKTKIDIKSMKIFAVSDCDFSSFFLKWLCPRTKYTPKYFFVIFCCCRWYTYNLNTCMLIIIIFYGYHLDLSLCVYIRVCVGVSVLCFVYLCVSVHYIFVLKHSKHLFSKEKKTKICLLCVLTSEFCFRGTFEYLFDTTFLYEFQSNQLFQFWLVFLYQV